MRKLTFYVFLIFSSSSMLFSTQALSETGLEATYNSLVDTKGNISLPQDYRQNWVFLGAYFVKNASMGGEASYDVHTVFSQPTAVKHYRKHGKFPDGAVLIKEVNATKNEALTTGQVSYQDAAKVTFMMIKDSKNRFKDNNAWGEGWGWALFSPGKSKSETTNWKGEGFNNCYGCHLPVEDNDWVYTQGYQAVLNQ